MKKSSSGSHPIVGIVASAGGLEAFKNFFSAMPADSGLAFVLVPHLDPSHESMMVDLLGKLTPMLVIEAKQGMAVDPNCIYIIPPNYFLSISQGLRVRNWSGAR
jgi:two-component system CheB/CheR fusion protein